MGWMATTRAVVQMLGVDIHNNEVAAGGEGECRWRWQRCRRR